MVHENEQVPIDLKIPSEEFQPTMEEIRTIDDSLIKKEPKNESN